MDKRNPLISIIVRTKDRPKLLMNALQSIAAQTYRPIEVVLVNDGGSDLEVAGVKNILGDVSLNYIRLENNTGRANAGNIGIENAKGDYIGFLDDDDEFYPEHVSVLVNYLEQSDHKVAYTDSLMVYKGYNPQTQKITEVKKCLVYSQDFDYDILIFENYIPFMCLLFNREVLINSGGLDSRFEVYEDHDLLIRLGEKYPFYHIKKTTADYNQWCTSSQISQENIDILFLRDSYLRLFTRHTDKFTPERIYNYRAKKYALLKDKEVYIDNLKIKLNEKDNAIKEKDLTLRDIYNSDGWRSLLFYYKFRDKLLPLGSQRRRLVRFIFNVFRRPIEYISLANRNRKNRLYENKNGIVEDDRKLICAIEANISQPLEVGRGNVLYLSGWCYHTIQKIKRLDISVDGISHNVSNFCIARPDILDKQCCEVDKKGNSLNSGFWVNIPFTENEIQYKVNLAIRALLDNDEKCELEVGTITLEPSNANKLDSQYTNPNKLSNEPLVAICMTTYNPSIEQFKRQIDSIINQTYKNWICIINDDCSKPEIFNQIKDIIVVDKRFKIYTNRSNLGFYHNFERCLSHVPEEASFIALSDQDDYWHEDKLSSLLDLFDADTNLVYSDMNIVNEQGELIHNTYWTSRKNNYKNLDFLLFANTITGAASVFRSNLLSYILPFPKKIGDSYHDHWIACVSLAKGKIKYIDRPLYDYYQHPDNIIGHYTESTGITIQKIKKGIQGPRLWFKPEQFLQNVKSILWRGRDIYVNDVIRLILIANVLKLRCGDTTKKKKSILNQFISFENSVFWLFIQTIKGKILRRSTLGAEFYCLRGIISHRLINYYFRINKNKILARYIGLLPAVSQSSVLKVDSVGSVALIKKKISPLTLIIAKEAKKRVNILIPTINFKYFFGGYIGKFNLAMKLAQSGYNVRIIIVDYCDYDLSLWKREIKNYTGQHNFFDIIEVTYAFNRALPVEVSSEDTFIATTWWTAHIANKAINDINAEKFVYFIQEFEPFTFQMGTLYALTQQTYSFPHHAIFSTELLRDYFRQNKIGVFSETNGRYGEENSISFENAILTFHISEQKMRERELKKFVFYARPEQHASRNMFELGVLALIRVIEEGHFDHDKWEFYGIGSVSNIESIKLCRDIYMKFLPKVSLKEYADLLTEFDLGLSLMLTPHPSLPPLEMAAAGMIVVTNTFANKTQEYLKALSTNIIAVEPTIDSVRLGLISAIEKVVDYKNRIEGSNVNWSSDWSESFNNEFISKIKGFIRTKPLQKV